MDDLISRQAAIESIRECAEAAHDNHEWDMEQGYLNAIECIEEEPSAQSERKKGRWTVTSLFIKCSECGEAFMLMPQNYCPNCGADMKGSDDEYEEIVRV